MTEKVKLKKSNLESTTQSPTGVFQFEENTNQSPTDVLRDTVPDN